MAEVRRSVRGIVVHNGRLLVMWRDHDGLKFISLPGGGVDPGEDDSTAVARELWEETSIKVTVGHKVFESTRGDWGTDVFYKADYVSGEPALQPDAIETKLNSKGHNTYRPGWLSLKDLDSHDFWPDTLKALLAAGVGQGIIDLTKAKQEGS